MIVVGAVVLAIGFIVLAIGLGVALAMWKAWWLHPLWSLVIVPLGVPQISYWHFVALNMTWLAFHGYAHSTTTDTKKESADKWGETVARVGMSLLWPMLTFYVVRWYLR